MLSPALLKHKDFRAPGHEMSQKLKKIRLKESLNEKETEQVCVHRLLPVPHELV